MVDLFALGVAAALLLQVLTLVLVVSYGRRGRKEPAPSAPTVTDTELKKMKAEEKVSEEVEVLKSILADPENLKAYATLHFRGKVEKAKKSVQERLKKLTGETFEVPLG